MRSFFILPKLPPAYRLSREKYSILKAVGSKYNTYFFFGPLFDIIFVTSEFFERNVICPMISLRI